MVTLQKILDFWLYQPKTHCLLRFLLILRYCLVINCREPAYCILSAALSTASSFRIWNSSTGILSLPGAGALPMAKVMRKEARHMQRRDRASGVPLEILEHLPPNQSLPTFCFVLSPTPPTLWGAVPHYLSEKRVSLQLQLIIPGCDSVSTYKLLWKSSSLPE